MDVSSFIKHRLKELRLEQRDLAAAAGVTESYISQLLTRKKAPPAADRSGLYRKMNVFLRLPKGRLSAMVDAQRKEELKKKLELADLPAPMFKEVRELLIRKCEPQKQSQMRDIFEKHSFGELERLIVRKLLEVVKKIAKDGLKNEVWIQTFAKLHGRSQEETRFAILELLKADVFNLSAPQCSIFLDPLIVSWDIDLNVFAMEILLNRRFTSIHLKRFHFVESDSDGHREEPGFREFLNTPDMSADATEQELDFLRSLNLKQNSPTPLYYYRALQTLRDPLHFANPSTDTKRRTTRRK
jgi:transcriptional regulator with XRE-family HTH domain